MAITVKHKFVSAIPDSTDPTIVRPSNWNDDHDLVGTVDVTNGGTGATTASGARTNLGLGTIATQDASAVAVTGGTINNTTIGATTASTGAFTTATASTSFASPAFKATSSAGGALQNTGGTNQLQWGSGGGNNLSLDVATNINPANAQVDISPTGTGTVRINPATAGTINNMFIGATTPAAGTFTTLTSTGTATFANASTTYVTVTGDASYPMIKATGGTNTPLVLSPLGTGALQAQKTDSTATGGNARGANAVDWQTLRNTASQVASADQSAIAGGYRNTASGGYAFVGGGFFNQATGVGSTIAGGNTNTASGIRSAIAGGQQNTAAGYFNFIGGGAINSGTANAAATTQSATMNGTTAVTLSGSNASIKVGQYITGTSIASDTYVAAISGTALTLSQNASGSSTSTLSFYTPHGVVVGGGNNQATGSYSFIGGGGDAGTASLRNVASGDWSFVGGGFRNTASGIGSFVGGGGNFGTNIASGQGAFIGAGWGNAVAGASGSSLGASNQASGDYSACLGGSYGLARSIIGNTVFSASNAPYGTAFGCQGALLVLARQTADATATVLASNASAASATNQVAMPINSAYYFKVTVIAGVTGAGNTKAWKLEGAIKKGATNGTTAIVGTVTTTVLATDAGAATWTVTATADTTNGALAITATGQASTTIRWVAKVETTEMQF